MPVDEPMVITTVVRRRIILFRAPPPARFVLKNEGPDTLVMGSKIRNGLRLRPGEMFESRHFWKVPLVVAPATKGLSAAVSLVVFRYRRRRKKHNP